MSRQFHTYSELEAAIEEILRRSPTDGRDSLLPSFINREPVWYEGSSVKSNRVSIVMFMSEAQVADYKAGTAIVDCSDALEKAINYANGREIDFPFTGILLISRQLVITAKKFRLVGQINERGCNAVGVNSAYPTVTIKYRPATNVPMIVASDQTAPLGGVIGPFSIEKLAFDIAANNLIEFGDFAYYLAGNTITDGGHEKYIFGVSVKECAIHATAASQTNSASGVMTRTGQVIFGLSKCFEVAFQDVSIYGGDIQVYALGCDKPIFRNMRSQGSNIPFKFVKNGTFTVQHTLENIQIENWGFTPIQNLGVVLAASNIRCEQNDGAPAKKGIWQMTETASVTAGSGTLTFSASMNGVLFPDDSIIRITDGTNVDHCLVKTVSGTTVTVYTDAWLPTWTNATATVSRIHGYGPIHLGDFGSAYNNISCGASLNCPAFVCGGGKSSMFISNAVAESGAYGNIQSIILANRLAGQFYLNQQMSFTNCTPLIIADTSHPLVTVTNWADNHGVTTYNSNIRGQSGESFEALLNSKRHWIFSPKHGGISSINNDHTNIPFVRINGDSNTSEKYWAWYKPAGTGFTLRNDALPSVSQGGFRIFIKCKSGSATDTLSIAAVGSGSNNIVVTLPITSTLETHEILAPNLPVAWTGVRTNAGLSFSATNDLYIVSVIIVEEQTNTQSFCTNGANKLRALGKVTPTLSTPTRICRINPFDLQTGEAVSGKIAVKATETSNAPGYCSVYTEYSIHFSKYNNTLQVVGTPAALVTNASSVNGSVKSIAVTITSAIVSGLVEIYANVTTGGSSPGTAALVSYELELIAERNIKVLNA